MSELKGIDSRDLHFEYRVCYIAGVGYVPCDLQTEHESDGQMRAKKYVAAFKGIKVDSTRIDRLRKEFAAL